MENEKLVELIQSEIDPRTNMGELYKQNRNFMWKHSQKYFGLIEPDDVMQECYFILDRAVSSYDATRGLFISWLGHCIDYYLPRQIAQLYDVKIPQYMLDNLNRYKRYTAQQMQASGSIPSDQAIIDALDITEKQLKHIRKIEKIMTAESIYTPISEGITLEDSLPDNCNLYEMIEESIDNQVYSEMLDEALSDLTDKQRSIINLRMCGLSFAEVCKALNINNRQSAHQSEKNSLKKIRKHLLDNGTLQLLYEDAYRGTLSSFNHSFTSTPERIAIKHLSDNEAIACV